MTRLLARWLLAAGALVLGAGLAAADVVVEMKDGREIRARRAERDGARLVLVLETGRLKVAWADVARVRDVESEPAARSGFNVIDGAADATNEPVGIVGGSREQALRFRLVEDPTDGAAVVALGQLLVRGGRHGEALAMLSRARPYGCCDASLEGRPELVRARDLALAEALTHLDRPREALAALAETPEDATGLVARRRARIRADLELKGDRDVVSSNRFVVQVPEGAPRRAASALLEELEEVHATLARSLGDAPRERIIVLLHPGTEFWEDTGQGSNVAGLFDGKVRVPVGRLDTRSSQLSAVLRHEVAHAFVHSLGAGRVPRTWHEGIAEHFEGSSVADANASAARLAGPRAPQWPPTMTHAIAHSRLEFFLERCGGEPALRDLIRSFATGATEDTALWSACRTTSATLDAGWRRALLGEAP